MSIRDWFEKREKVVVFQANAHDVRAVRCIIDRELRLVRAKDATASWPVPAFDATPVDGTPSFLAIGPNIVPWPTKDKPAFDIMDDGTKVEITPEHIDQVAEHAHKLGRLAAAGEMSLTDRLIHLGAGAAIGLVLGFILIKYLGFSIVHDGPSTVVTISNTTNATSLKASALVFLGSLRGPRSVTA